MPLTEDEILVRMTAKDREPENGDRLRDMRKGRSGKGLLRVVDYVHQPYRGAEKFIRFTDYAVYEKDWGYLFYELRFDGKPCFKKVGNG